MAQTVLYGALESQVAGAVGDGDHLWIPLADLPAATGWTAKPEGLCRGEVCVPVPRNATWLDATAQRLDFAAFAAHLGHAAVRDDHHAVWAFGPPAAERAIAGDTGPVMAQDFTLPDLDGNLHSLAAYRGKKVLLYCWSSW